MPAQPQDRQPAKGQPFTFNDAKGKKHALPPASTGRHKLTGREFRDATMGGELGMTAYMFKLLEAADPKPAALDALYSMPQTEMMDVLQAWGEHGDGDGASLGE